jgi:hemoglobin
MAETDGEDELPFDGVGGEARVRELAARFYDHMDADEPALARLHQVDELGRVSKGSRERFATFLVEWLGGPLVYSPVHGHPRLRMRHGRVPVDVGMRDAWLRCMAKAMDEMGIEGNVRRYLDGRFAEVAELLRNVGDEG